MVLQSFVVFLAVNTPADNEAISSFLNMHKKRGAKRGATDQPNPPKQHPIFRYMNAKIWLLGCV